MQRLAVVQGLVYMTTNFSTSTTLSSALLELGTLKAAGSSFGLPTNKMERFWWGGGTLSCSSVDLLLSKHEEK